MKYLLECSIGLTSMLKYQGKVIKTNENVIDTMLIILSLKSKMAPI